jgi:hypothetical protein
MTVDTYSHLPGEINKSGKGRIYIGAILDTDSFFGA